MPRNVTESGSTYCERHIVRRSTGVDIGTPINATYDRRVLQRPDPVRVPKVDGFRKPTAWHVVEKIGDLSCIGVYSWFDGTYDYKCIGSSANWSSNLTEVTTSRVPSTANDTNRAAVQCLLKIKAQKVNLSVAAAEMHKTVDLIASRASSLLTAVRAIRKGNITAAARALSVLPPKGSRSRRNPNSKQQAQNWLELQYGWMPLLQDIEGSYKLATEKFRTYGMVVNAKSSVEQKFNYSLGKQDFGGPFDLYQDDTGKVLTIVALSYRVNSVALSTMAQAGLDNPLTVAWELTPFSFLVDWLIPVGNFLDALTATQGLTFLGGSLTKVTTIERKGRLVANGRSSSSGGGNGTRRYFEMDRTLYSATPVPIPYYKNPFSVGHAYNAIALLVSALKR